ncbi:MAG: methionyl-tRNA formyltransferase [Ktedonobacterales bacterium]
MQRPGMHNLGSPVRVVFMGTPDFAVPSLAALLENAKPGRAWHAGLDVVGVVTRPDKPAGRGRHVAYSPVKQFALDHGVPVMQPGPLRRPAALAELAALAPDLIVVAAFGQILPPEVLGLARDGCLNVHASLLPRHRGAAPIAGAILAGDVETGITIMLMDAGLDTGPMLAQAATPLAPDDTAGRVFARLAELGAHTLLATLPLWLAGGLTPQPQDEREATLTRPLAKDQGRLDWSQPALALDRQVRAFSPWPGAFTTWDGKQLKVIEARAVELPVAEVPGRVIALDEGGERRIATATGQGVLELEVIQLEGRRALPVADVLRGHGGLIGATLGT